MASRILKSVLFWVMAMAFFAVFRFYGIDGEPHAKEAISSQGNALFHKAFTIFLGLGLALGLFYAVLDYLFERYTSKKIGLGATLLLKTLFYFGATIFVITITIIVASQIIEMETIDIHFGWWVSDKRFWAVMIYILLCSLIFYFINTTAERFGKGRFISMLLGKYRKPKEEDIIFMFLDLKDSTTIAEKLGHHAYSMLIQECFYDLNDVLAPYNAQIYQYVGDEAVVYWPYKEGLRNSNCLRLFFEFENLRNSKKERYLKEFGVFPEFKAGIHGGTLTAVEVGHIKKELAYHGDVINTTARIQAECNKQNVTLLISDQLLGEIKNSYAPASRFIGNVLLKGKQNEIKIHTVTQV